MTSKKLIATVAVGLAAAPALVIYGASAASASSPAHSAASTAAGKKIYQQHCETCHGAKGEGKSAFAPAYKTLTRAKTTKGVIEQLEKPINTAGCKCMPSFKTTLKKNEKEEVAAYVVTIHTA